MHADLDCAAREERGIESIHEVPLNADYLLRTSSMNDALEREIRKPTDMRDCSMCTASENYGGGGHKAESI